MSALVNGAANAVLDKILGEAAPGGVLPSTLYWGLLLAAPNNDGSGVSEPVGNGYARISLANNLTQWPAATARAKTHANDIVFPAASGGNWGLVSHFGGFDALSGGTLRCFGALATPRQVNDTDIFRFLAGFAPITFSIP